ncbi:unnamed protein product [Spodoptera exigua]|nr:unnamed protein product [Spodoptera exigua]
MSDRRGRPPIHITRQTLLALLKTAYVGIQWSISPTDVLVTLDEDELVLERVLCPLTQMRMRSIGEAAVIEPR